nr:unnamed protein product [Callosobruchus analis]
MLRKKIRNEKATASTRDSSIRCAVIENTGPFNKQGVRGSRNAYSKNKGNEYNKVPKLFEGPGIAGPNIMEGAVSGGLRTFEDDIDIDKF